MAALKAGYRHIDTAHAYGNERSVGQAVKDSGIPREEIWITSKLWPNEYDPKVIQQQIDKMLERLGLEYIDLIYFHQPLGNYLEGWKEMEIAQAAGKVRAIGISNFDFNDELFNSIVETAAVKPQMFQIECHPYAQRKHWQEMCAKYDIKIECWFPLGGRDSKGEVMRDPVINEIAAAHGKSAVQTVSTLHRVAYNGGNTAKVPIKIPQILLTNYRKNTGQNTTKVPISYLNPENKSYLWQRNRTNDYMDYLERAADRMLMDRLDGFGAVLIEGPKWCGKTTTASQHAKSIIKMQDPDNASEYLATAATKPSLLLKGANPRLIDEWQDAPVLWDTVRNDVDGRTDVGLYILTGSNAVKKEKIKHSGTGRIAKMKMYPMSLWESKESSGEVSLQRLFDDPNYDFDGAQSPLSVEDLIFLACRGGWPASLKAMTDVARLLTAQEYINTLCSDDINRIDGIKRNERIARMILRSYARNVSTLAKKTAILADITSSGEFSVSMDTMDDYLDVFNRLFVIKDIEAWCPPIRSKTAIRSGLKREFIDPSIAVAALGLAPEALQTQLKTFGFIFENMCARDLCAYSQQQRGELSYYRDRYNLESDLVLHLADGRYALIECKLGSAEIEDGASHLKEIVRLVREYNKEEKQNPIREPDLLIVLTGGKMAYTRPDGVKVIPLGCLKW